MAEPINRRHFLKQSALAAGAMAAVPLSTAETAAPAAGVAVTQLTPRVLFDIVRNAADRFASCQRHWQNGDFVAMSADPNDPYANRVESLNAVFASAHHLLKCSETLLAEKKRSDSVAAKLEAIELERYQGLAAALKAHHPEPDWISVAGLTIVQTDLRALRKSVQTEFVLAFGIDNITEFAKGSPENAGTLGALLKAVRTAEEKANAKIATLLKQYDIPASDFDALFREHQRNIIADMAALSNSHSPHMIVDFGLRKHDFSSLSQNETPTNIAGQLFELVSQFLVDVGGEEGDSTTTVEERIKALYAQYDALHPKHFPLLSKESCPSVHHGPLAKLLGLELAPEASISSTSPPPESSAIPAAPAATPATVPAPAADAPKTEAPRVSRRDAARAAFHWMATTVRNLAAKSGAEIPPTPAANVAEAKTETPAPPLQLPAPREPGLEMPAEKAREPMPVEDAAATPVQPVQPDIQVIPPL